MNIELSIAIMAHPKRMAHAKKTSALLPGSKIFCDNQLRGVWWNGRRCHNSYSSSSTHMLVLQDDLLLCKDFIDSVKAVIEANPNEVISLYNPHLDAVEEMNKDKHWMIRNAITGQAILMPIETEIKWQRWQQTHIPNQDDNKGDDFRLSLYLHFNKLYAWYTAPSLVQHIGQMNSTLGYNNPLKYSKSFVGEDQSATTINWLDDLTHPKKLTYTYSEGEFRQYGIDPKFI